MLLVVSPLPLLPSVLVLVFGWRQHCRAVVVVVGVVVVGVVGVVVVVIIPVAVARVGVE
jgi:hypothetical protein